MCILVVRYTDMMGGNGVFGSSLHCYEATNNSIGFFKLCHDEDFCQIRLYIALM